MFRSSEAVPFVLERNYSRPEENEEQPNYSRPGENEEQPT